MELKNKKINFLGDSITEGVGTSCKEAVYHSIVKEKLGLKEARNYGVGGTRIARQTEITSLVRDRDFILRAESMDKDADLVVVFGGTNDFGHGQAPLGTFEDRDIRTFYGALHALINMLIDDYGAGNVLFMTPLHRHNDDGRGAWKPEGVEQKHIVEYVNAIKETCAFYLVPVLDLFNCGELTPPSHEWYGAYMPDGLHPNDAGHVLIANKLQKFLENL